MDIRPATADDARGLAIAHTRSWQSSYRGLLPDAFLDAIDLGERTERWRERLLLDADGTLVAVTGEQIAGFTIARACRDDDPADRGEIWAMYVHPDHWRRGVGRSLMDASLDALREDDFTEASLWVLRDNARAIAFYEVTGWLADGTSKREGVGGVEVTELRFRREL